MCLWFKTSQATTGMVSMTVENTMTTDRHMGLRDGKPQV